MLEYYGNYLIIDYWMSRWLLCWQVDEGWWLRPHHESGTGFVWWRSWRLAVLAAGHRVGWPPRPAWYSHHRRCRHPLVSLVTEEVKLFKLRLGQEPRLYRQVTC